MHPIARVSGHASGKHSGAVRDVPSSSVGLMFADNDPGAVQRLPR